ncbi:hypothetical protein J1N35_004557 [Gossypium stocksii]|uniref:Uncharacterized protein n=1 Tax=Gossypium stocksii TaxID=47602 RepID=A0A9D4AG69_9ROSI|nr:hypothetical protein J1N35_004557 [Gossypium stocksii]
MEKRDVALKRFLQNNFTKPMPIFPGFPKELQASIEDIVKPTEAEPGNTNLAAKEKKTKSHNEDIEKTESVYIETDNEGTEKETPTLAPPKDSTAAISSTSTEVMTEQYLKINCIIDEITKSDNKRRIA